MSSEQSSDSQPSMIGGHVKVNAHSLASTPTHAADTQPQYVQGAVSSALGYESGQQTKAEAVQQMKDANAQPSGAPTQSSILGTVENAAGKVTGCEGMEKEGQERIPNKTGIEEQSGTG